MREVTKRCIVVLIPLRGDSDLELILRSRVAMDLPVMDAAHEALVAEDCPEHVGRLLEETLVASSGDLDAITFGLEVEDPCTTLLHVTTEVG